MPSSEALLKRIAVSCEACANPIQLDERSADETRELLRKCTPSQTLAILFSKRLSDQRPPQLDSLVEEFREVRDPGRDALIWVYGDSPFIAERTFLRLPSREKRILVTRVVSQVCTRFPWMNSKLLHAMAFRPAAFRSHAEGEKNWGPLYRRMEFGKGSGGKRVIHAPNLPLKITQRALLEVIGDEAAGSLPDWIFGTGGDDGRGSIFDNAACHIGQQYVATFDLKNFFPSIRTSEVVTGLRALDSPMFNRSGEPIIWSEDAILLVAKLCTYRGRLPQGAPTSPLLANIAFAPYDKKIKAELDSSIVYSRYFDDISVSIHRSSAISLGLTDEHAFLEMVNRAILTAIDGSPFQLNDRKTHKSSLDQSHRIMGLNVGAESLQLSRSKKRLIRSFVHQVRGRGMTGAACHFSGPEVFNTTEYRASAEHRNGRHYLRKRRLPSERLAVLMMRSEAGDLRLDKHLDELSAKRLGREADEVHGAAKWFALENIISNLWRGELSAMRTGPLVEVSSQDTIVAKVNGPRAIDFLLLDVSEAMRCVEFWHRLNGFVAFLASAPAGVGDPIREYGHLLSSAISESDLVDDGRAEKREIISTRTAAPVIYEEDDLRSIADNLCRLIDEYQIFVGESHRDAALLSVAEQTVRRQVSNGEEFQAFVDAFRDLTIGRLEHLPPEAGEGRVSAFRVARLISDIGAARRCSPYRASAEFYEQFGMHKASPGKREIQKAQRLILKEARSAFIRARDSRNQAQDIEKWKTSQAPNQFRDTSPKAFSRELEAVVGDLTTAHEKLSRVGKSDPIFNPESNRHLRSSVSDLERPVLADTSEECWAELASTCMRLYKAMFEGCIGGAKAFRRNATNKQRKRLWKIGLLRNYAAHLQHELGAPAPAGLLSRVHDWVLARIGKEATIPKRQTKRQEWLEIQKDAARLLGSAWKSREGDEHESLRAPGDLQLTPLEATELKLSYMKDLMSVLSRIERRK